MQEFDHICASNFPPRLRQLYYQFLMPERVCPKFCVNTEMRCK